MVWVATYTANLVAFFTVKTVIFPVSDLQTAIDSEYKFGVVQNSLVHKLLYYTKYDLYERALAKMPTELPKNKSQALAWIRSGHYIHLDEGPFVDYIIRQEPCDLMACKCISKGFKGGKGWKVIFSVRSFRIVPDKITGFS